MDKEYTPDKLPAIIKEIKKQKGKYNCVIGVSGGCDSSYLLHLAVKEWGLRPLAVNVDNNWDTKIAKSNLKKVTSKLGVDVISYVADEAEFNDIARTFIQASIPEVDGHSDLALAHFWHKACKDNGIKYFLIGHSFRTEGMFPIGWFYFDGRYIQDVYGKPFKTFPNLTFWKFIRNLFDGVKQIRPIWYLDYDKAKVKKFLEKEYGWEWYGGHHYENKYTRFHHWYNQVKFGIDQRVVEYSAMIRAGLISKAEAVKEIEKPNKLPKEIYKELKQRLGLTDEDFEEIMYAFPKSHRDFKTYKPYFKLLKPFFWVMLKLKRIPYSFYKKYC